ncbi:tRNA (adenosine(37)-N6)-threonylcarbamoyltransferase complex dimerization subunit type 1 TsaB [Candidatus Dependentiae bacterium]|nr:tRNA (adenosine(37)-N6)-threonylcarbamoyltransferase complex dimerization subunit type 1 TsaB [Candidatus Dependentiae bacterium]
MPFFLAVHTRYSDVQLGLFNDTELIDSVTQDSKKVSKDFLYLMQDLLHKHAVAFTDLRFIAAHQGPAPFTTLRVALASVNGLAFATHIPLIGVDGLQAFLHELAPCYTNTTLVVLLNAFCQEVYYGIRDQAQEIATGYDKITVLLERFKQQPGNFMFVGNGSELYKADIQKALDNRATFVDPMLHLVSLKTIGLEALKQWQTNATRDKQLMPVYMKICSL